MLCKEFVIDYDKSAMEEVCDKIGMYRTAVEQKKLPPRMAVCELTPRAPKPRNCPFGKVCVSDVKSTEVEKKWGNVVFK